jgi:hypothetical protein
MLSRCVARQTSKPVSEFDVLLRPLRRFGQLEICSAVANDRVQSRCWRTAYSDRACSKSLRIDGFKIGMNSAERKLLAVARGASDSPGRTGIRINVLESEAEFAERKSSLR